MWGRASIHQLVVEHLQGRMLVVASNREPYIHRRLRGKIVVERGGGGLITVLDTAIQVTGGVWVSWGAGNADWEVTDQEGRIAVPPDKESYLLKRVRLTQEEVEQYYHGFSNRFCWPLFHGIMERVQFKETEWQAYQDVNRRFAEAIVSEIRDQSAPIIWIQDYHLCCVPRMVRERRPDTTLSLFWHIPWPSIDIFSHVPCRNEILKSLLCCDFIGFQTDLYRDSFLNAVSKELNASIDPAHVITYRNRTTRAKTFAASIDTEAWNSAAARLSEDDLLHLRKRLGIAPTGLLGIGVDRIEYTKGLIERFDAIDLFLSKNPQFCKRFTFVQVAPPSRVMMIEYQDYQKAVDQKVRSLNKKYGTPGWEPVVWYPSSLTPEELVIYYRAADIAIVSSLADGMNLVAKEFVASQIDENGVLLLSQFAGTALDMQEAILMNPNDTEGFAKAIETAFTMSPLLKKMKMRALRKSLQGNNVYKWVGEQLLESCKAHSRAHS